jgi:plastocyanin
MLPKSNMLAAVPFLAGLAIAASLGLDRAEAQETVVIEMTDQNTFEPGTITIRVGDTVEWQNGSSVMHTATFDPDRAADASNVVLPEGAEPFDSGSVNAGESWSHTFETAGTYQYICRPHELAGMIGEVVIEE